MLEDCRFHHLGVACRSLEHESDGWLALGYRIEGDTFVDPVQKVRGVFLTGPGPRLELLEPAAPGSPLDGFLARGAKIYHQGFEADDFDDRLVALAEAGGKLTARPAPAVAFAGRRVAFVLMPTLNLIEIIEAAKA